MQAMKISILGASFNTPNMGVGALAAGTLTTIWHQYPGAEISFLDYAKQGTTVEFPLQGRTIPVKFMNIRFSKKFYLPNNIALLILLSLTLKLLPAKRLRQKLAARNAWLQHIYESDLFVSMSGGDSFSDIYGFGRFLYVVLPQLLVIFCGKRLVLLPQTLGPFKGRLTRAIANYVFSRASVIYSRDYQGLKDVDTPAKNGHRGSRLRFCYDVGFVLEPRKPLQLDAGLSSLSQGSSPVVGLNVSGLLAMGGYTQQNMFGLKADYNALMVELIRFLIEQRGATVLLVPHVFDGEQANAESDTAACRAVYRSLQHSYNGKVRLVEGKYDQSEIKYIIGMCDFFVGSRMHACIAALSQGIPALAIAYSDKFIGVLQTLGIDSLVADARQMDVDSIVNAISDSYDRRSSIRKCLERKIPLVKDTILGLFADIEGTPARA
jgi:polysaccharide pyruvyl transferase WcaK-like protein